eukprot:CAMPEP_0177647006 /NCGR_PEP_ID=MMETSP0447-20121125/10074_1 /TAXON_ID=0 /ORGANISM="Stygamoeba regulata, Strain BSH-02190019" /LENGTH=382 /DNA_ID=CAMNT_0019149571 /DNA_START=72 /DNA_END=1220 /DNA_ORIENTATION=+
MNVLLAENASSSSEAAVEARHRDLKSSLNRHMVDVNPDVPSMKSILLEPYKYLAEAPGKGIRERLISSFNKWLKVPEKEMRQIVKIIRMLHNASLMIDDIEDNSTLRRGIPVVHHIYGVPSTLNTANYVIFLSLQKCYKLGNEAATSAFINELIRLHRGQGLDVYWRDNNICPTEEEYISMVIDKTGGLFRLSVRLMQSFSKNELSSADFVPLVNSIGVYFQILDDYINLQSEKYMQNKSYCEDIQEGKFSFPLLYAIRANPKDTRILNILKQRTDNREIKAHAVEYLRKTGAFDYTLSVINKLYWQVESEINKLGGNESLQQIMTFLYGISIADKSKGDPEIMKRVAELQRKEQAAKAAKAAKTDKTTTDTKEGDQIVVGE